MNTILKPRKIIGRSPFSFWCREAEPLFEAHHREIATWPDKIRLAPDYERFKALERAGHLLSWTVREGSTLVGYAVVIAMTLLHNRSDVSGYVDLIYLKPEARRGRIAVQLIDEIERTLRGMRASKIQFHVKVAHDFGPLLERRGMIATEKVYEKVLI